MKLNEPHKRVANDKTRFRVLITGRRFGKTGVSIRELAKYARLPDKIIKYFAPTHGQAKEIVWDWLQRELSALNWISKVQNNELKITLVNRTTITVAGLQNYEVERGKKNDFMVIDEFQNVDPRAWSEVLRPTLSTTKGHALLIGTPKGKSNWSYDLFCRGQSNDPKFKQWKSWQFTSIDGGWITEEEIESARCDLDERTFNQEYLATFESFTGLVYYPFDRDLHCGSFEYNPRGALNFCFDFNVSPGVAVICQEQMLPNGLMGTAVIDEVYIPENSNTLLVCQKLIDRYSEHKSYVRCYGDATGGAGGSAKVDGSDWQLIRKALDPIFRNRLTMRVPRANPKERERVNALNSRLKSTSNLIRLMIDKDKCPKLLQDFESTPLDEHGAIDKKKNKLFSHMTDALGYYVVKDYPLSRKSVVIGGPEN